MTDVNALVGGLLLDLALAQASPQKKWGYKRASRAILTLDVSLSDLRASHQGALPRISGIGPASARVIDEVLTSGASSIVEDAVAGSPQRSDIERHRGLRQHVLSRAEVLRVLTAPELDGPRREDCRGDLQMHSEWSDGKPTVSEIAAACHSRGYEYAAVTDHSYGLKIARGMSMKNAAAQRRAIDDVNAVQAGQFRLLQGVEANIGPDGELDLSAEEAATFDIVLAAPHSRLRVADDQTDRLVRAVEHAAVRILAHPRGRMAGSRVGVVARWDAVFAAAEARGVAVEIDGDPSRQDLDFVLAGQALRAGCLFALDSDAHTTEQLAYADTALAHARLAGIPADRIVNCWPLPRLLAWLSDPKSERRS